MTPQERAYASIGRAVLAAQTFEIVLIAIFESFKIHTEVGYPEKAGGMLTDDKFRQYVSTVTKYLSKRGSIDPEFQSRIEAYSNARNTLVHNWVRLHGWPSVDDDQGLTEHADLVRSQAVELTRMLAHYSLKLGTQGLTPLDPKLRFVEIFKRAHLEEPLTSEQLAELGHALDDPGDPADRR